MSRSFQGSLKMHFSIIYLSFKRDKILYAFIQIHAYLAQKKHKNFKVKKFEIRHIHTTSFTRQLFSNYMKHKD